MLTKNSCKKKSCHTKNKGVVSIFFNKIQKHLCISENKVVLQAPLFSKIQKHPCVLYKKTKASSFFTKNKSISVF